MNGQEKKNNYIKFYTQYASTYTQPSKNKNINSNSSKKNPIKNIKNNIVVYSNNNFLKSKNKEIPTESIKYYNKNNKIIIDNLAQDEKLINNSVNINLINSMNNITFCETNLNNSKINPTKNSNITVNKKINFIKEKKNLMNYKKFGINIALKGLKENNNIINNSIMNQKIKGKIINVNKSSINKNKNDLKIINSSSDIFSSMQNRIKHKNNNYPNYRSPKNLNSNLSMNINKPKSEEKNFKKSKKKNKYNNIFLSNFDDKINNILISGNNTTTNNNNNNFNKKFFSHIKTENKKISKEKKFNLKSSNLNLYSNNISSNKKFNKSNILLYKNKINNNLINSFEKIEVNKKPFRKETETRNESFNIYLEKTHQNSWTSSKEKINSFSNLDNIIYHNKKEKEKKLEKTPKNISSKVIYNKKQLSIHNQKHSLNDIKKILSPNFENHKKNLLSENLDKVYNFNDSDYENNNNLVLNEFTYKKKIPMNNIYKKPDIRFINNSFLLLGKDALINKNNNLNHIPMHSDKLEENTKRKFNAKLNKFLLRNKAITEANKDKTEFSILLNSENNNNSKEITMDTNMNLNEISIITKINNKVINNYNFTKKYYIYFVKINKQEIKKPCFISKKRINRNILKICKIPSKTIYYITKTRKIYYNIIPKTDICYFRKLNINNTYDLNYKIKPILTEKTSKNENKNKIIHTTKRIVNIEKYDNNYANKKNLKKTEIGLNILEKIADKRISLSSLLTKKNKNFFDINIKNDFIENLNKISNSNYDIILNQISNLIISSNISKNLNIAKITKNQNDFIEIIINKGTKEKKYIKIYAKLCKDLFVNLMTMIDNYNNDIDIFDKITKEKSLKKLIKTKIMTLLKEKDNFESNIIFYFICELIENKIFSIKSGFEILDLLFKQYMNDSNILHLSGIEILLTHMKKIILEKNNLEHIQRYNKYIKTHLYNIFQKNSKNLPKFLYYRIYNLLQNNNKNEFIPQKIDYIDNKLYQMIKSDLEYIINNQNNSNKKIFFIGLKDKYDNEFNKNKNFELYDFFYYYIETCIDIIDSDNKVKYANEYIINFICDFSSSISNEVWEILHYKLISLFLDINEICVDNIYMYQIMGYLLYILLNNKLFYIKDLNNFLEKENYVIINIAKVVKYSIIFAEKNAKKFHNDFKQTKLFYGNDIFYNLVTFPLKKKFYEI